MTEVQTDHDLTTPMRWTVRILALLAAALFVFFAIYLGARVFPTLSWGPQGIPLLIVMGIALLGFLVAWRWEVVGGIITVAGATGIVALVCLVSG